jgi:hypothetical protein
MTMRFTLLGRFKGDDVGLERAFGLLFTPKGFREFAAKIPAAEIAGLSAIAFLLALGLFDFELGALGLERGDPRIVLAQRILDSRIGKVRVFAQAGLRVLEIDDLGVDELDVEDNSLARLAGCGLLRRWCYRRGRRHLRPGRINRPVRTDNRVRRIGGTHRQRLQRCGHGGGDLVNGSDMTLEPVYNQLIKR